MRRHRLIDFLLLVPMAAILTAAAEVPMLPGDSLILNVYGNGLAPVAIRGADGQFRELPAEDKADQIRMISDQFFKPGKAFEIYRNGQATGELKVSSFEPAGCTGFGYVSGVLSPPVKDERFERFVTFTPGFPGRRTYAGSQPVSEAQKQEALALARKIYSERGVSAAQLARLSIDSLQGLRFEDGKREGLMLATRLAAAPEDPIGCHSHHLLLVAEQAGGKLVPKLELLKKETQAEGMCSGYNFVSSFETGPGAEYLLVEGFGWEWNWYEIFRRTPEGTYTQEFSGGGGGC